MSFRSKHPRRMPARTPEQGAFFKESGSPQAFFSGSQPTIQPKLSIGQPNDAFEQEADAVADQVVNQSQGQVSPEVQREEQPAIMQMGMEEEELMMKPELMKLDEEELLQGKPELMKMEEEEEMMMKPEIMKMEEEEEPMQGKPELMKMEEEEELQMKPEPGGQASTAISQQITSSQGRGQKLPASTAQEMSAAMGHDFSDVTIHTDQESAALNRSLGAQAFTHGQDVYFNEGKFNPDSSTGKHLLAHELTHVVQQSK